MSKKTQMLETVVLDVGDAILTGDKAEIIESGSATFCIDDGSMIAMDGCVRREADYEAAVVAWEDGHKVFEVSDGFIGLWR